MIIHFFLLLDIMNLSTKLTIMKKILITTFSQEIIEQWSAENRKGTDVTGNQLKKTENTFLDRLVSILDRLSDTRFGKFFGAGKYQWDLTKIFKQDIFQTKIYIYIL